MKPNITKKYAVGLSTMANSFYDPDCGANLFKSSPVYQFNHKITPSILSGVKSGTLIDIVGNIIADVEGVTKGAVDVAAVEAQVRANVETEIAKIKADHEAEIAKLKAEHDAAIAKLTTTPAKELVEEAVEEVKETKTEEVAEEVAETKEAPKTAKKK